ncbi:alpha/beta hydrolase [Salinibacter grassmerensis]|uniref:alpha/beta hydrolase n=1 Tax=Salinibacter grassmerensis TaxID=3040353 RepID=UPI0021E74540|nr:alpha/beta hydrolase-fold protein [Salinibacter grassmerensis]
MNDSTFSVSLLRGTTAFRRGLLMLGVLAAAVLPAASIAQDAPQPVTPLDGTLERVTVHGASLEGNLVGDSPDRPVSVYLPPSYDTSPERQYPVVYVLHGFTNSDRGWFGWEEHFVNVPAALERGMQAGTAREMILVVPNAFTAYEGSMYSSSATTGDWETFVAEELVDYVDQNYRTLPDRDSRGLAGHSMGGYGTLRIGMKRPDVFSSLYAMSPCCLQARLEPDSAVVAKARAITHPDQVPEADFLTKIVLAWAAAWSPDPKDPPLYLDLPREDGALRPDVVAEWAANAPLALMHQHVPELRRLTAIGLDAGAQDQPIASNTQAFAEGLAEYGVDHTVEIYDPGTHVSRIDARVENHALPFFSDRLAFSE